MDNQAIIIDYLYEDLPEDYVVLAQDWNLVMSLIKAAINNHAGLIDSVNDIPFIETIGSEGNNWSGGGSYYTYYIEGTKHKKGGTPKVQLFLSTDEQIFTEVRITPDTGDIFISSEHALPIRIVISA